VLKDKRILSNQKLWDSKVASHFKSEFYRINDFINGWNSLNTIEKDLLGDVNGKKILHLQCHFGQDTLSLQRMGAKCVGVDFSLNAINQAKELNVSLALDAEFIYADVLHLGILDQGPFDIVYTSYGTIGWLPNLNEWAKSISTNLKTGGKFIFVEFHPFIWTFDNDLKKITYPYFNRIDIVEEESISYADNNSNGIKTITWNHSLGEVYQSLKSEGLDIIDFNEFDYSPYNCMPNLEEVEKGKYKFKHLNSEIPMTYSIVAVKQ